MRTIRDDPHTPILFSSKSVIVTSSKILAERINDFAMRFGASASHAYELGSVERIAGYDAERILEGAADSPSIWLFFKQELPHSMAEGCATCRGLSGL